MKKIYLISDTLTVGMRVKTNGDASGICEDGRFFEGVIGEIGVHDGKSAFYVWQNLDGRDGSYGSINPCDVGWACSWVIFMDNRLADIEILSEKEKKTIKEYGIVKFLKEIEKK